MIREVAKREIESLDFYLQNHTDDYGESSHTAMMMAAKALETENALIDRVLEIIDKHGEQLVHSIVDGSYPEIKSADILASVREDVLALKGGEQE